MRQRKRVPSKTNLFLHDQKTGVLKEANYIFSIIQGLPQAVVLLVATAYLISTLWENSIGNLNFDTAILRGVCTLVLIPVLFSKRFSKLKHAPILSSILVGVLLPFCFGVIVLMNAALSPASSPVNQVAVTEYVLAGFFFVQLLFFTRLTAVIWTLCTIAAFLPIGFVENPNWESVQNHCFYAFPFFLTTLLVGGIINNGQRSFQHQKEMAVWNVANSIAHQLRTPLATIRNIANGGKNEMPELVRGYGVEPKKGQSFAKLSERKIDALSDSFNTILEEVGHSSTLINILIKNSRPIERQDTIGTPIKVSTVVIKAVDQYPYNNPFERNLINLETEQDFTICADEIMILHVLFNLLSNAVLFAQKKNGGEIKIWLERGADWNKVHVRDNGTGISRSDIHRIFDPFFSQSGHNGTGIGLSFCKSVLESIGGKITCESEKGTFCHFMLYFPHQDLNQTPSEHFQTRR